MRQLVVLRMLDGMGFRAEVAHSADAAITMAATKHYDLVLMDADLKGMDGYEATRILRELEREIGSPGTPVVGMGSAAAHRSAAVEAGMDGAIPVPLRHADVRTAVERWLGAAPEPSEGPRRPPSAPSVPEPMGPAAAPTHAAGMPEPAPVRLTTVPASVVTAPAPAVARQPEIDLRAAVGPRGPLASGAVPSRLVADRPSGPRDPSPRPPGWVHFPPAPQPAPPAHGAQAPGAPAPGASAPGASDDRRGERRQVALGPGADMGDHFGRREVAEPGARLDLGPSPEGEQEARRIKVPRPRRINHLR